MPQVSAIPYLGGSTQRNDWQNYAVISGTLCYLDCNIFHCRVEFLKMWA